jgi:hypothetical protein
LEIAIVTSGQRKKLKNALASIDCALRDLGQFWTELPEPELDEIKENMLAADAYVREALGMPMMMSRRMRAVLDGAAAQEN